MEKMTIEDIVIKETGVSKEDINEIVGKVLTKMGEEVKAIDVKGFDEQITCCAIVAFMNYAMWNFMKGRHSLESKHSSFAILVYHCAKKMIRNSGDSVRFAEGILELSQERNMFFGPLFKL